MTTLEQTVEEVVELLCEVVGKHPIEQYRQRAQTLLNREYARRLTRDGKHPITGETPEEYDARIIKAGGGIHPVTGEARGDFLERTRGKGDAPKK